MESNVLRYFCITFALLFKYEQGLVLFLIRVMTEEIFPPVNRPDVTPVIMVSPWGGSFEFSLFSLGFKYPASAVHVLFRL